MQLSAIDRTVSSICPVCLKVISAHLFSEDGRVYMEKCCEEHGQFRDLYWSDATLYTKFNGFWCDGQGIKDSFAPKLGCPFDCGLCWNHLTATLLANIDLTSRCNLSCPVCFANAGDRVYEPDFEQIRSMLQTLRDQKPVPCPAVQFSGGEPTLREDLPLIIALAKAMGFAQIQVASNGLRLASNLDFCRSLEKSGCNTIYLQFDGLTPAPYQAFRGRDLLPVKLRALENLRTAGPRSVVLVPTLARQVNDQQVGDMVRFAAKNLDLVRGINFQPVSFSGRIDAQQRARERITIPDLLALLEEQTDGQITGDDFYPVPFVVPISRFIAARSGNAEPAFTVHPCCGAATYIYSHEDELIPITRFLDVEGLMERINSEAENLDGSRLGDLWSKGMLLRDLPRFVDEAQAPDDLNLVRVLFGVLRNGTRESIKEFHRKTLFLGAMHFQDAYNLDLERLQRCGVHYATPDGRIIPFCSYNILHRRAVEDRFSQPKE